MTTSYCSGAIIGTTRYRTASSWFVIESVIPEIRTRR